MRASARARAALSVRVSAWPMALVLGGDWVAGGLGLTSQQVDTVPLLSFVGQQYLPKTYKLYVILTCSLVVGQISTLVRVRRIDYWLM